MSPEVEEVSLDGPELAELLLSSLEESSDEPVLESELPEAGVLLELVAVFFVFWRSCSGNRPSFRYRIHWKPRSGGSERCRLPSRRRLRLQCSRPVLWWRLEASLRRRNSSIR